MPIGDYDPTKMAGLTTTTGGAGSVTGAIQDLVYACPSCGSPSVKYSELGGDASCGACPWNGDSTKLIGVQFSHEFAGGRDEIIQRMMVDLRNTLASSAARSIGSFLLKWGFMDQPIKAQQLARYLAAVSRAMTVAIFVERKKMVEEKNAATTRTG